jgi:hypothetical protein
MFQHQEIIFWSDFCVEKTMLEVLNFLWSGICVEYIKPIYASKEDWQIFVLAQILIAHESS